ncbi:magnesium and cobalt transport protein CorA [Demequina lignilytica]|uniref:Magnesium and cobalt transport protein CorA n=1 Tax=Demequina lignilytica TaxID=3051663 RepID=A0AB35MER8_9MICO|nr:magnesium and cobalt transport protein CorA [Demequina sp. SYSU T0a273]MDN4482255.1 magnesium and cobalt transport protein CorA [Demequina sp. SYSU T0a273]
MAQTSHGRRRALRAAIGRRRGVAGDIPPVVTETPAAIRVVDGVRVDGDDADGGYRVIVQAQPTAESITALADDWGLHPLLAEDLHHAGQRPKLERFGEVTFIVARAAWYVDASERVELAEVHLLVRPDAVAVLCQDWRWIDGSAAPDLTDGPGGLLEDPELLHHGSAAFAYRVLDRIVDGYGPVLDGLALDQEQIERQVFTGEATVTERIYRLSQEVVDLKHACAPLAAAVGTLVRRHAEDEDDALAAYVADVADHLTRVDAEVTELRASLAQILDVNATLVAQRQNEDMKKISGWAAILFAPTLVAAIYGMNFDRMPELHWAFGYPLALATMVAFGVALYTVFKRRGWF